ncbi:Tox-REase-5 domain-containing protein [Myxococcus landrumensis]|nr:Tox-REase-5 domain-containing protein [Myxococcus landrumus]
MLREVLATGEVSRAELARRVERFSGVAVLRPDGYLAWVRTGATQQRVAPVEWRGGAFRAHGFELGRFYSGRTGVFRLLDAELRESNRFPIADVHDDADVISRGLDGAEEAFVGLALAVGKFFSTSPAENLEAFRQMPAAVVALIKSSPEYLERFRYMSRGEQIQAASKLVTNLVATWGTASAVTRTLHGTSLATSEASVLVLSGRGVLSMESVAVPAGRAAAVLSGGPGAAIILQRAGTAAQQEGPSEGGPGRWESASESMSDASREYQAQVTGAPIGNVYNVEGVRFDGFNRGILLETKGPGYAKFLKDGSFRAWFRGADGMLDQARRQFEVVRGTPIHWHFAERDVAGAVRDIFRNEGLGAIKVVHTPIAP